MLKDYIRPSYYPIETFLAKPAGINGLTPGKYKISNAICGLPVDKLWLFETVKTTFEREEAEMFRVLVVLGVLFVHCQGNVILPGTAVYSFLDRLS